LLIYIIFTQLLLRCGIIPIYRGWQPVGGEFCLYQRYAVYIYINRANVAPQASDAGAGCEAGVRKQALCKKIGVIKNSDNVNKKSGVERLFEIYKKDNIEKAIIIENNHVYTYGYERSGDHKAAN